MTRETTILKKKRLEGYSETDVDICQIEDQHDISTLELGNPDTLIVCQYIVYSVTFQVPAFYFTVHRTGEFSLVRFR